MSQSNSLEKISSFSFPSNHLINFQLMRDLEKTQTSKPEYFFFVSFIPGAQGDEGNRTYDFNSSISLKFAVYEIAGLSWALKQYAQGNGKYINYTKFTKSTNSTKTLILEENVKTTTGKNNEQYMQRQVFIKVNGGGNVKSVTVTLDQAYAIGETLDILFKKATELEFNRNINSISFTRSQPQPQRGFNQTAPVNNPPTNSFENNNSQFTIDDDDNSNYLSGNFGNFTSNPFA